MVFKEIQNTNWVLVSYVPVDAVLSNVRTLRTALLLIEERDQRDVWKCQGIYDFHEEDYPEHRKGGR